MTHPDPVTPKTAAGLRAVNRGWSLRTILAIEEQAAQQERERIRAALELMLVFNGKQEVAEIRKIGIRDVLAILAPEQAAPQEDEPYSAWIGTADEMRHDP